MWTRQLNKYCWGGFDKASNDDKILKYWNMQESKCLTGTVGQEEKNAVLKEMSSLVFSDRKNPDLTLNHMMSC